MTRSFPQPRTFTQADGRINFRECLAAAHAFWDRHSWKIAGRMALPDWRIVTGRVRDLAEGENARWASLAAHDLAAATAFDALLAASQIEACDAYGRDVAIEALAADRPAIWTSTSNRLYVSETNADASAVYGDGSSLTVFERLVVEQHDYVEHLFALNNAGAKFLRNVRAARAYRRRPIAA